MKRNIFRTAVLAAGLVMTCFLVSCGYMGKPEELHEIPEAANLRMIVMGNEPESGMEELYEALDELTVAELGCTVRFEFIPWGNERKQLNIAVASGEYDIIPGGVFSDWRIQISKNAFLDLTPYLHLVPDLVEHYGYYSEDYLEKCKINGGLYGISQYGPGGLQYDNEGFFYREDLRRKWGCDEITNLDTMEEYLYAAKADPQYADEALITDNRIWQSLWILTAGDKYLEIGSMTETPFVVVRADEPKTVVSRLETEEFREVLEYIKKWQDDGILEAGMLALSDNEGSRGMELMLEDRKPCETNNPIWSISSSYIRSLVSKHPEWEYGFFTYISANRMHFVNEPGLGSAMYISSKTKYPEQTIRLLEKIHTDQRYYDLFAYGVEGIHYVNVNGKVSYEGIPTSNKFSVSVAGDELLRRTEISANEQWADVNEQNAMWREGILQEAVVHPLDKFTLDIGQFGKELERINLVKGQYFQPIVCGYYEGDEDLELVIDKLEEAGLKEYMAIIEAQLQGSLGE